MTKATHQVTEFADRKSAVQTTASTELPPRKGDNGESLEDLGRRLKGWLLEARTVDSDNRHEMAIDQGFVDGNQWRSEDMTRLVARGQLPLVFNHVRLISSWLTGTEKRNRVDWRVVPRTSEGIDDAEVKTELLKYLHDVNKFSWHRSQAFQEAVDSGLGWLETGVRQDAEDEPIYVRWESWRNVWYDREGTKRDPLQLSECRYLFRARTMDLDVATTLFPKHEELLRNEADSNVRRSYDFGLDDENELNTSFASQVYFSMTNHPAYYAHPGIDHDQRKRLTVRLIEAWYREPAKVQIIRGLSYRGEIFDPDDDSMASAVEEGTATLFDGVRMVARVAIMTQLGHILNDRRSPYRHNRFPFVPVWGYRNRETSAPYGVVRNIRDPQMDLNKRRSKALWLLSTSRWLIPQGSLDDEDHESLEEELGRPDVILHYRGTQKPEHESDRDLANSHITMSQENAEFIREISGVTGESLGEDTNANSGRAIIAKQRQGNTTTADLFSSLRFATLGVGEMLLSLVEQYYTAPRIIRLIDKPLPEGFMEINAPLEDGGFLNDITANTADFVVSEQDYHESVRQQMFDQLMELLTRLPGEAAMQMLDLIFEFSDLPNKDEIIKRVRQINGQPDPNDPQAKEQLLEQQAQQQQERDDALALEQNKMMAEIKKLLAQAAKDMATAQQTRVETQGSAVKAGAEVLQNPVGTNIGADIADAARLQEQEDM